MKIKVLKRTSGASLERKCTGDLRRSSRNLDPTFHPMQRAREYTRAVVAAKMDRMFAQPLVGNLGNGHRDAVTTTARSRTSLAPLLSGGADGCLHLWDLVSRTSVAEIPAHSRTVTGTCFARDGQCFYSCSDDGVVHRWPLHSNLEQNSKPPPRAAGGATTAAMANNSNSSLTSSSYGFVGTWRCAGSFKGIDQSWTDDDRFATASDESVQIWSPQRTTPLQTHKELWGSVDTVNLVRWHPVEGHLLANCSVDRGVGLHDTRTGQALRKTVMAMRSNDLQWNPMEPMNFLVANEDNNCYLFDMRNLTVPTIIYKGHVGPVLSVAWSPTGREFVSGSYDKTIRIFELEARTSRDVYHTKRMQRVWTVQYTSDAKFVVSGSDDTNLRLWKAVSNEQLGQLTPREEAAMQYRSSLIERYKHTQEVQRIHKSRKLPKPIRTQHRQNLEQKRSRDRKQENRVKHDRKGEHKFVPEGRKAVVKEIE